MSDPDRIYHVIDDIERQVERLKKYHPEFEYRVELDAKEQKETMELTVYYDED